MAYLGLMSKRVMSKKVGD